MGKWVVGQGGCDPARAVGGCGCCNFGRLMDTLIDHAGVSRITPKGFRHTARSVGWVVVDDDKVMRERLAYADIGITRGDVHPHGHRPAPRGGRSLG